MDKDKLIQVLSNLPETFFKNAYLISSNTEIKVRIQMKYNSDLVKELINANRWGHRISVNGFMEFTRDDNLEITMT